MPDSSGARLELPGPIDARTETQDPNAALQLRQLEEIFRSLSEISHKINNPLTAVMGRAQLLRGYPDTTPKVLKTAEIIEESAARIAELVREVARLVKAGQEDVLAELSSVAAGRASDDGRS